jgi:hypothetical protein
MRYLKANAFVYVFWMAYTLFLVDLSFYFNMHDFVLKRGFSYMVIFIAVTLISLGLVVVSRHLLKISIGSVVLFLLFSIIVTFLFFGKSLLYTADGLWLTGEHLSFFVKMLVPISIYILLSLCAAKKLSGDVNQPIDRPTAKNHFVHMLIMFVFQVMVFSIYMFALNPGNMSYDTFNQVSQLAGLVPYNTWHPIGHTLLIGLLVKIWNNFAIVTIFQIVFFSLVTSRFYGTLIRFGVGLLPVYALAIAITLIPNTGINVVTQWKDIPYTVALLWGTNIILLMCLTTDYFSKKRHGLEFIVCTLSICLFRYNGILAFLLMVVLGTFYIIYYWERKKGAIFGVSLTVISSMVILVNIVIPAQLNADPNPPAMKLRTIYQGLGAVYYAGCEASLDAKTREVVESVATPEQLKKFYNAYFADVYSDNIPRFLNNLSQVEPSEAIKLYISTMRQYPDIILGDKFNLAILIWSATKDPFSYNNNYTTAIEPKMQSVFGVKRDVNILTDKINAYAEKTTNQYLSNTFFWRVGFWLALSFILLLELIIQQDRRVLLYIPLLSNAAVVFLTMPAQDYRYVWFIALICPFLILSAMIPLPQR